MTCEAPLNLICPPGKNCVGLLFEVTAIIPLAVPNSILVSYVPEFATIAGAKTVPTVTMLPAMILMLPVLPELLIKLPVVKLPVLLITFIAPVVISPTLKPPGEFNGFNAILSCP